MKNFKLLPIIFFMVFITSIGCVKNRDWTDTLGTNGSGGSGGSGGSTSCSYASSGNMENSASGNTRVFWNTTSCQMKCVFDNSTTHYISAGDAYYYNTSSGTHSVTVSGCGFSSSASFSVDTTGNLEAGIECNGTNYTLVIY